MRVVVDTNVLISAFLWQGTPKEIFVLAQRKQVDLCVTTEILTEFKQVLSYPKFRDRLATINKTPEKIIDEFLEIVRYYPEAHFAQTQVLADPSDDKFLACALSAKASFIISGDVHLLALKKFGNVLILTPRQFLSRRLSASPHI